MQKNTMKYGSVQVLKKNMIAEGSDGKVKKRVRRGILQ
jgi:hypothetical protein